MLGREVTLGQPDNVDARGDLGPFEGPGWPVGVDSIHNAKTSLSLSSFIQRQLALPPGSLRWESDEFVMWITETM
ncbi:hypothetical protein GCM10027038_34090 [Arthrobacter bambusae]